MGTPHEYSFQELLLHVDHVNFTYEGSEVPTLRDVTGAIYNVHQPGFIRGQVVALLGPSGIGKSTLFRIIAGLTKPTSGMVRLNGHDRPVLPGEVGVVTQNYYVLPHHTVLGNLVVAGKQAGMTSKAAKEKALGLLTEFGLADKLKAYPKSLSGGQRQRVAITQQLMCSEHFILMDEPFSGLDPVMKDRVCKLILKLSSLHEHNTIVVVTHDIHTALTIADFVWLMGRERTPEGQIIPGARIIGEYNLIDMGLAWHENVQKDPVFHEFTNELVDRFPQL